MPVRKRLSKAQGVIRHAVRQTLLAHTKLGQKLLIAVSGGADSMALAAACLFEANKQGRDIAAAIIDHGLQTNSSKVANQAAKRLREIGFEEVLVKRVKVGKAGGQEAAARVARYQALEDLRIQTSSDFVLLGHTQSDQAETVLLGLVRGSGAKSLSGMGEKTNRLLRPLLSTERSITEQFCVDSGIMYWSDPQNKDKKFLRVLIRLKVLPFLEATLGGSVAKSLVRTSDQLREDHHHLETDAFKKYQKLAKVSKSTVSFEAASLAKLPKAILHRVIKQALDSFGGESSRSHVLAVADLVFNWHGQKPLSLPGVRIERKSNTITVQSQARRPD